mmetsp:Transcript_25428/g.64564  ORF Transcript_25428/g.64564 Transcript_25428/m.64564 type:complete len:221 (-) Transcript_25428:97-759(-)
MRQQQAGHRPRGGVRRRPQSSGLCPCALMVHVRAQGAARGDGPPAAAQGRRRAQAAQAGLEAPARAHHLAQVVLVVVLRVVPGLLAIHRGGHLDLELLLQRGHGPLHRRALLGRVHPHRRLVLALGPLRGVVLLKEARQQVVVRDDGGVVPDAHRLRVAVPTAHGLIRRVHGLAARVAHACLDNTRKLLERSFGVPESAKSKRCNLHMGSIRSIGSHGTD